LTCGGAESDSSSVIISPLKTPAAPRDLKRSRGMKFTNRFRLLLIVLLALGLFGGELSESFRLADDFSNDYVQASASALHKKVGDTSQGEVSQRVAPIAQQLIVSIPVIFFSESLLYPVSDLLRLISVQRE
jgi:hypothetical protein